jgi:hypothetical protein
VGVTGFQRRPLVLDKWEAEELKGFEVRARRLSVAETRALQMRGTGGTRTEREHEIETILASAIHSWNYLDDDGSPVEPTVENLDERIDPALLAEVADALVDASTRVAPPLPKPSDAGLPSAEEFKLMDDLSSSQPSSPGPDSS